MKDFTPKNAAEALADAWASIDGKTELFRQGRGKILAHQPGGHYFGYLAEAEEMILRLRARGYRVRKS